MNSKPYLKTTKTKLVPYGKLEYCWKIEGVCYLELEASSNSATDKFYVVNR